MWRIGAKIPSAAIPNWRRASAMIRRLRLLKRVVTDGHDNCIVDWKTASAKWPVGKADTGTAQACNEWTFATATCIRRFNGY